MVLVKTPIDYEIIVNNLIQIVPAIYAVAIIEENNEIVYSTNNWDISTDVENICFSWDTKKAPFIIVSGIKYTTLECEIDSMVATSLQGNGHIVGCKNEERKIITYVEPKGDRKAAIVEISRILAEISPKKPYIDVRTQFGKTNMSTETKGTTYIDLQLKNEIEEFLNWIKDPDGFQNHVMYQLQLNDAQMISQLSKIYAKLIQIIEE